MTSGQTYRCFVSGDTEWHASDAYREGADAARKNVPYQCNPYRINSQRYDDWNNAHVNEGDGIHRSKAAKIALGRMERV